LQDTEKERAPQVTCYVEGGAVFQPRDDQEEKRVGCVELVPAGPIGFEAFWGGGQRNLDTELGGRKEKGEPRLAVFLNVRTSLGVVPNASTGRKIFKKKKKTKTWGGEQPTLNERKWG